MQNVSLNYVKDWLSCDIVRFKIEVGVDAKCTVKTRKMATTACNIACSSKLLQPVAIRNAYRGRGHCTLCRHTRHCKICRSVCVRLCVCRKVYCGKTAEWIQMPFGIVSGVSRMMGVLDGVVIVEGKGAVLGVNLGRPTVTNGDYAE